MDIDRSKYIDLNLSMCIHRYIYRYISIRYIIINRMTYIDRIATCGLFLGIKRLKRELPFNAVAETRNMFPRHLRYHIFVEGRCSAESNIRLANVT
jgi:hypothetical protein